MRLIEYKPYNPRSAIRKAIIANAKPIIEGMADIGIKLTLRGLHYQFVSRNLYENTQKNYKLLGETIKRARESGLLPCDCLIDESRQHNSFHINHDPLQALGGLSSAIGFNVWKDQNVYVECWIEKAALLSAITPVCERYRVPFMACKGNLSFTEAWEAGFHRFRPAILEGRKPIILHLGDHDPSGIDMTRDLERRVGLYSGLLQADEIPEIRRELSVKRIGLNIDQVEKYDLPKNFAKLEDKNAKKYISRFGPHSWELDALDPMVLREILETEITNLINPVIWNQTIEQEKAAKAPLRWISENPQAVLEFAERKGGLYGNL